MPKKLRLGVGAKCTVLLKYLHPGKLIDTKYPNRTAQSTLDNLLAIRQEVKKVNKKEQHCILFRHGKFEGLELHCVNRWVRVIVEGPEEHLFVPVNISQKEKGNTIANEEVDEGGGQDLDDQVLRARNCPEDIAVVRAQGLQVDDDNVPAPKCSSA